MPDDPLPPLKLRPQLLEKPWGGRKLGRWLGKELPDARRIGESWEASDYPGRVSEVAEGPLAGTPLDRLIEQRGAELLGPGAGSGPGGGARLPWLFKFLDAAEDLSVQLHPRPEYLAARGLAEPPKREAWYVLQADPGAAVYVGLAPGVGAEDLRRAVAAGRVREALCRHEAGAGDVFFIAPGVVHVLGAGVVAAEVQRPSDLTLRLYDWGRTDARGQPRPLHLEDALASLTFDAPPARRTSAPLAEYAYERRRLIDDEAFRVELLAFEGLIFEPAARPVSALLAAVEGAGDLIWDDGARKLDFQRGDTLLVPAALGGYELNCESRTTLLCITPGGPAPEA